MSGTNRDFGNMLNQKVTTTKPKPQKKNFSAWLKMGQKK